MAPTTTKPKHSNLCRGLISALKRKDDALKEYAHITSHELRAPVARILGLVQILSKYENDQVMMDAILNRIHLCAQELDKVTRKLSEATYDPADGNTILEKMIYQYLE